MSFPKIIHVLTPRTWVHHLMCKRDFCRYGQGYCNSEAILIYLVGLNVIIRVLVCCVWEGVSLTVGGGVTRREEGSVRWRGMKVVSRDGKIRKLSP